jgi:threonine/homoserine/homoserine lactone efflux protein
MPAASAGPLAVSRTTATIATERPYGFFVRMGYACAAVAFLGFAPTYWAPVAAGTFSAVPIVHLHGLLFFAWTVLFVVQAHVMNARMRARHRALGLFGIALATAMLFAGIMVAIHSLQVGIAAGADARARAIAIDTYTTEQKFDG